MGKKIVKLTTEDLVKHIKNVVKEQEEEEKNAKPIALGVDNDGNYYIIDMDDPENPTLLAKTK